MSRVAIGAVIEQMMQPGFYPHAVSEPIQLIQTHCSYVVLTGDYVYKLKKPVNLDFLDYSTLEKRQHFCQEELRLNKKAADEIYLEVVAIIFSDNKYQLGGTGEAVEYALKMRQFPQETLFSEMFERGKLEEQHIARLAKVVAQYHQGAATNDYISSFGEVTQVQAAFDENYQQTKKYIGVAQTQQQLNQTKYYTDKFFSDRAQLFKSRIANKSIRECHGDLHLRNICLWHSQVMLFDCIEFNEAFRYVDVIYDVAFVIMDLEARNRKDLSNIFLNNYIEQTGDYEGVQLLPLYASRQAYVRAKVTSFLLDDPDVPQIAKQQATSTAASYYRQAWEYTKPTQGQLMLMSGLSGSGKSTTARYLAQKIGAVHLRSDAVRKHLAGIPLLQRGGDELYTAQMTQKTYSRLMELGIMLARLGFSVILDAKYDKQQFRGKVIEKANQNQIPLKIVYCTAPLSVLQQRIVKRNDDVADSTADLLPSQMKAAEPFTDKEKLYLKILDTTQSRDAQLKEIY
ncbi:MAG: AAA family ATPase [Rivularia sp. (in: Bacteria)]|nr:AAA family ATPase [Rivularia sp. MS3]